MKKILLLGMSAFLGFYSVAQYKNPILIDAPETPSIKQKRAVDVNALSSLRENKKKTRANKVNYNHGSYVATLQGISATDWYSFQQAAGGSNPNGRMVYNYLWPDSTMRYGSTSTAGMTFLSIGQVLDPRAEVFTTQIASPDVTIGPSNAYNLDSLYLFCSYNRVPAQAAINDTLILSFVVEDATNLDISGWTSGNVVTNFSADTVTFLTQSFDSLNSKPPVQKSLTATPALVIKKVLNAAAATDTIGGGWNYFGFAPNLNVPAGRAVSVSVSYKPGSTWVPFVDSIADFNNFLFVSHEQTVGGFFSYTKWDFNSSNVVTKSTNVIPNVQGWGGTYLPALAYTAPYAYEFHDIDWVLTCTTCGVASVNDFKNSLNLKVYPNPANDQLTLSLNADKNLNNTKVEITNVLGQTIKTFNLGTISSKTTRSFNFDVSDVTSGIYLMNIISENQKAVERITIN